MKCIISGHNLNNGKSLEAYVEKKLHDNVEKYFHDAVTSIVTFEKVKNDFYANIEVHEGTGKKQHFDAKASDKNIYKAFNLALDKELKQLRRFKDRLDTHH
jgi:ribosomal subunit interface protein